MFTRVGSSQRLGKRNGEGVVINKHSRRKRSVMALYKELALQHNRSDLLTVPIEFEEGVRENDCVGLW